MDLFKALGSEHYDLIEGGEVENFVRERYLSNPAEIERNERLMSLVPSDVETLLDVGACYGLFLHELLKTREIEVEGVDVSEHRMSWGRARGLKLSQASAHELPYGDRQFHMVTCAEVLEHLTWGVYEQSLHELNRVADRWILISVPYDEKRGFTRCPYCRASVNPDYHMRSFTPKDLEGLFADFKLCTVDTICQISVATLLKPFVPLPWRQDLVCPVCSYRAASDKKLRGVSRLNSLKRLLMSLPLPKRPRWLVGLFERVG